MSGPLKAPAMTNTRRINGQLYDYVIRFLSNRKITKSMTATEKSVKRAIQYNSKGGVKP